MEIRKAHATDLNDIMNLINQAKNYFKANRIDQWQDGYPNEGAISDDISHQKSYVLIDHGTVIGTMYFAFEDDPDYHDIRNGQWLTDTPYGVVHRIVVDEKIKGHGTAHKLLSYAEDQLRAMNVASLRMDTHLSNVSMQRFLHKNGFTYCGEITIRDGAPRIGFEKIL